MSATDDRDLLERLGLHLERPNERAEGWRVHHARLVAEDAPAAARTRHFVAAVVQLRHPECAHRRTRVIFAEKNEGKWRVFSVTRSAAGRLVPGLRSALEEVDALGLATGPAVGVRPWTPESDE